MAPKSWPPPPSKLNLVTNADKMDEEMDLNEHMESAARSPQHAQPGQDALDLGHGAMETASLPQNATPSIPTNPHSEAPILLNSAAASTLSGPTTSLTPAPLTTYTFFNLPGSVRSLIYGHVYISHFVQPAATNSITPANSRALLAANRQIRGEATERWDQMRLQRNAQHLLTLFSTPPAPVPAPAPIPPPPSRRMPRSSATTAQRQERERKATEREAKGADFDEVSGDVDDQDSNDDDMKDQESDEDAPDVSHLLGSFGGAC